MAAGPTETRRAVGLGPVPGAGRRSAAARGHLHLLSSAFGIDTAPRDAGGHPGLFSPPELCLLPFGDMADRQRQLERSGYGFINRGLAQALQAALGIGAEETEALMRRQVEEKWPVAEVYRTLQEAVHGRRMVDKSPMSSANREWMARAEALFSGARYVYLVRHPYSVVESFVRMRFDRLLGPLWGTWDDQPAVFAERTWTAWNREILAFLSTVPAERQHRVRYEDLVASPAVEAARLCAFLGLPSRLRDAGALLGRDRQRAHVRDASTGRFTIGDPTSSRTRHRSRSRRAVARVGFRFRCARRRWSWRLALGTSFPDRSLYAVVTEVTHLHRRALPSRGGCNGEYGASSSG